MKLNQERLRGILSADHSYYGTRLAEFRRDERLKPSTLDFIAAQLSPDMRVLDIGCGNGTTLLENSHLFASGLGIDNDPDHVALAEEALQKSGCANVEFRLLNFPEDRDELQPESFNFAFTERGPIGYDSYGIQAGAEAAEGRRPSLLRDDWQSSPAGGSRALRTQPNASAT